MAYKRKFYLLRVPCYECGRVMWCVRGDGDLTPARFNTRKDARRWLRQERANHAAWLAQKRK